MLFKKLLFTSVGVFAIVLITASTILITKPAILFRNTQTTPNNESNNTIISTYAFVPTSTQAINPTQAHPATATTTTTPTQATPTPQPAWLTFTNKRYHYSFKYPRNFVVNVVSPTECPPGISGCIPVSHKSDLVLIKYKDNTLLQIGVKFKDAHTDQNSDACEDPRYVKVKQTSMNGEPITELLRTNGSFVKISQGYVKKRFTNTVQICPIEPVIMKNLEIQIVNYSLSKPIDPKLTPTIERIITSFKIE